MRVHFVAVCGTGMGSLAGLFREAGHEVSGSDSAYDPPMGPALKSWGVRCLEGFDPSHIEPRPDLVVIGNVCRRDNPLARAAIDGGLRYTDMAHGLAEYILEGRSPLVVAGTHGKTTTTAMAAWLLHDTGREPGFLVGGLPKNFERSFSLGSTRRKLPASGETVLGVHRAPPFVVEGDEYDTAFFEKTPKFWHYRPEVAIVTSIEHDHVDIYASEADYHGAFAGFLQRVPPQGLIVASAADPAVVRLVREHARAPVAWFALQGDDTGDIPPEWLIAPAVSGPTGQSFDLFVGGQMAGRFALPVPGEHNLRNAAAALGAVIQGHGVPVDEARRALARFQGVRRRQDLLGTPRGVFVYDDFAHHPTAVEETLRAIRSRHPSARILAAFEPRSATACRAVHQQAYARAFRGAQLVVIAPRGRTKVDGDALDLERLIQDLHTSGQEAKAPPSLDAVIDEIAAWARPGDVVLLMSNGTFGGVPARLVERLEASLCLEVLYKGEKRRWGAWCRRSTRSGSRPGPASRRSDGR
jgi:UDP-N-acetylmuramate: L-alanyl-gamma-D-glutamyl-meso-diaminopimelate ligase